MDDSGIPTAEPLRSYRTSRERAFLHCFCQYTHTITAICEKITWKGPKTTGYYDCYTISRNDGASDCTPIGLQVGPNDQIANLSLGSGSTVPATQILTRFVLLLLQTVRDLEILREKRKKQKEKKRR